MQNLLFIKKNITEEITFLKGHCCGTGYDSINVVELAYGLKKLKCFSKGCVNNQVCKYEMLGVLWCSFKHYKRFRAY